MKLRVDQSRERSELGGAMTDISFLMIIFFLVTAVFVGEEGLFSNLPDDDTTPKQESKSSVLNLSMLDSSTLKVNDSVFANQEEAIAYINALYDANPKLIGFLSVNEGISYQQVMQLIASVKSIGVSSFTMVSAKDSNFSSKLFPLELPDAEGDNIGISETGDNASELLTEDGVE